MAKSVEVGLFAHVGANTSPSACPGGVGLTTALVALRSVWKVDILLHSFEQS